MTQEEKQLLLQELCARIPHRTFVCLNPGAYNKPEICALTGVHGEQIHLDVDTDPFRINNIKPYLRPMSSMTEEERLELSRLTDDKFKFYLYTTKPEIICYEKYNYLKGLKVLDWLNEHHFDFRGLIDKGLALEALPGMYETE